MITNTTDLQKALFAELEALQNEDNYKDRSEERRCRERV